LTKAEKKQASDWDQGREECQEWFLKCTEPDAKHKKAQVPQTILDKVCWAINEAMPNDGRAMAYIPQTAQSQEGYVQNSRGRKRAVANERLQKVLQTRYIIRRIQNRLLINVIGHWKENALCFHETRSAQCLALLEDVPDLHGNHHGQQTSNWRKASHLVQ